jgi:hypothetical protein
MEFKKDYIWRLLMEKVAGTISDEDDQWIKSELDRNPDAKQLWEDVRGKMNSDTAQSFLKKLDAHQSWLKIKPQIEPARVPAVRNMPIKKWVSIAAVLILFVSAGAYFFIKKPGLLAENKKSNKVFHKGSNSIELHLSGGKQINLSDSANRLINLGTAKLSTREKAMSFASDHNAIQEWSTLEVPAKLDYKVVLADGTEVWLNSASSLRFPFSFPGNTRDVYLQGEAFFKVAKNKEQPFIVHTGQTEVRVVGTSFNIHSYDLNHPITSLVEGTVMTKIKGDIKEMKLSPGFQAVFDSLKGFEIQAFKPLSVLSWMQGVYYFHNTPLRDIKQVLERWFDVEVVFDNPRLADLPVTGGIEKNKSLQIFLSSLEATAGIKAVVRQGVLHLK